MANRSSGGGGGELARLRSAELSTVRRQPAAARRTVRAAAGAGARRTGRPGLRPWMIIVAIGSVPRCGP